MHMWESLKPPVFCLEPYFVFMTFKQRQNVFNATHMAQNQQSLVSAVSPMEVQK